MDSLEQIRSIIKVFDAPNVSFIAMYKYTVLSTVTIKAWSNEQLPLTVHKMNSFPLFRITKIFTSKKRQQLS